jgi:DNA recombination protein RmuC
MTPWIAIVLVALVAIAALWMAQTTGRRQSEAQAAALRQEMQTMLAAQSLAVSTQLGQLTQSVIAQLGQVAQQVQSGMASTSTLASDAQKAVSERLQASTEMISAVQQKLGEMQEAGRELSEAAKQIENVLGGAKSRGTLGEVALDRILADTLPAAAYELQHRFATGEIVDAAVRLRDKILPVDSKFPLDDYRRLIDAGEEARKGFAGAVRGHADSIAKKYILPGEGTLDIALMFVPSEGVYYELLRSTDTKGTVLDEYCRNKGVVAVSPNTLFSFLRIVALGLRGMQVEENATKILSSLSGLKKQFDNFGDIYSRLGSHLHNAQQSYQDAERKLDRARNSLEELAQGAPTANLFEPAAKD